MSDRRPKDLLAGRNLLGFARRAGAQVPQRASSAKVLTVKVLADASGELPVPPRGAQRRAKTSS